MDVKKRIETCLLLEKMYKNKEYAEKVGLQDNSYSVLVSAKKHSRKAVRTYDGSVSDNMCNNSIC